MEVIRRTAANASAYMLDLMKVFKDFDLSGDGFLSIKEMASAFLHMGVRLDSDTLAAIFRHFDPNDSGSVHFGEFQWGFFNRRNMARQWKRRTEGLSDSQLRLMFHEFDKNGDGRLNRKEFKKLLIQFGMIISDDEQEALTRRFDEDGDGDVDMHEFFNFIQEELKSLHLHPQHNDQKNQNTYSSVEGDKNIRSYEQIEKMNRLQHTSRSSSPRGAPRGQSPRGQSPRGFSREQSYKPLSKSPARRNGRSKSPSRRNVRPSKNEPQSRRNIIRDNDNDNNKLVNVDDDDYDSDHRRGDRDMDSHRRGVEYDRNVDPPHYHDSERSNMSIRENEESKDERLRKEREDEVSTDDQRTEHEEKDYKLGIAERNSEVQSTGAYGPRDDIHNEEGVDEDDRSKSSSRREESDDDTTHPESNHIDGSETLWATKMLRAQAHIESRLGNRYY